MPSKPEPRKRPLKYKTASPVKITSKEPYKPSKWLLTIVRQRFEYFAERLD